MTSIDQAPSKTIARFWLYWYPLVFFQDVKGSTWERSAALRHNHGLRHLLVDTMLRWWALAVWLLVAGERLQRWGQPALAKVPLGGGAILLAMSATPLAAYLLLGMEGS